MSDTKYLQSLLDKGGIVRIPEGRYTTGPLFLKSGTTLAIDENAVIQATTDESEYPLIETRIAGIMMKAYPALLNAIDGEDITIEGKGTIDGSGPYWWGKYWGEDGNGGFRAEYDPKGLRWAADYDTLRLRSILVQNSKNIKIKDLTLSNAGFWNLHVSFSEHVDIENIRIESGDGHGPSTDGIDIDSSCFVRVRGAVTVTNDDSICIKSGRDWDGWRIGRPSHDIVIEDCTILKGFGITLGSEVSGGIYGITIRNIRYRGTDCGFRIKSSRARKGYIRDIKVENLDMIDVMYPVHIALDWNPSYSYCTLPKGYEGEIPEHWKALLERVPDDVPDTIVENIEIKNVTATLSEGYKGRSRAFNIEGYEHQRIKNVHFSSMSIHAREFGIISAIEGLQMDDVLITSEGPNLKDSDDYDNR